MSKNKESRTFNISVVGLSGAEKEKGAAGIGKSCFCNRFIRPRADDYHTEHITILSQIDFSGRVVNNDHFLYWGRATKTTEEGQDLVFNVIEQTEFIDDATYQAHRSSVPQHYIKRAAATKLISAEKLMYICTDQLGIEHDFEQQPMPEGKLNIDGFLLCVDVSRVAQRSMADQLKFTDKLLVQVSKSKKPVLLLATKCDRADEQYLKDLQAFASSKKVNLPLLETSAQENINIVSAFMLLAQMIDKLKGKQKLIPYGEAAKQIREFSQTTAQKYEALLKQQVRDYHALWNLTRRNLEDSHEYKQMVDILGLKKAEASFKEHLKRLKLDHIERKKEEYLQTLPKAFESLVPDLNEIEPLSLAEFLKLVQSKPDFEVWFVELSDPPWSESRHIDLPKEKQVPFDFLKEFGSNAFYSHKQMLQTLRKKAEMKERLRQLLENANYILPGKPWEEVYTLTAICSKECYQVIPDKERIDIYQDVQKNKIDKAKHDYQEMLLEHSETFADVDRNEAFNHDRIGEIMQTLEDDSRYKALRYVPAERDALILKHIFFVHHPTKESCFSRQSCVDLQVEQLLSNVVSKTVRRSTENLSDLRGEDRLGVLVFGKDGLGHELHREVSRLLTGSKLGVNEKNYTLELKVIDGDVTAFLAAMQNPCFNGKPGGYLCTFNSIESFKCVTECLDRVTHALACNKKDGLHGNVPILLLLANHKDAANRTHPLLRQQAQQAANKHQVAFIDGSCDSMPKLFQEAQVKQALVHLATSCQEAAPPKVIGRGDFTEADLYVTMCVMCGDPFNVDLVLTPFFESCFCTFGQPGQVDSVSLEMFLGSHRKKIKITVVSYHMATLKREDLTHGYILVYSAKRKASMASMRAFLSDVPDVIPVQLVAITESQNEFFENVVAKELVSEGEHIASEIRGRFCTVPAQSHFHRQTEVFTPFFVDASEKRPLVEDEFRFDPTMNVSSEALNQSGMFSSSSLSDSDDDDCQPPYSPASDEAQLLPNTSSRNRPVDVEGNNLLPMGSIPLPHDGERTRKSLPPKPVKLPERLVVNKLDPKLIEKINESISKGPSKAQLSRAPLAHAEDTDIADVPAAAAAAAAASDAKPWSKLFTRSRVTLNGSDTEESVTDQDRKAQAMVRRRSSYRYRSQILQRRQVYPSEVMENGQHGGTDPRDGRRAARGRPHTDAAPLLSPGADGSGGGGGIDNPAADLDDTPRRTEGSKKKPAKPKYKDSKRKSKKKKGKKKNSYFGMPLKDIVQLPEQPIPVFLKLCVEYIERNGLDTEGLYRVSGNKADQQNILQLFEKDHNIDISSLNVTVHTVTGALKSFFADLPDPLLPYNLQKSLADAVGIMVEKDILAALQDFVKKLPLVNYEVFKFIVTHFYRVCQHSTANLMSEENLSICFWPTLMKPNFSDNTAIMAKMVSRTPIRPFIVHCPRIFHGRDDLPPAPDGGGGGGGDASAAEASPAEGQLVDIEG